MPEQKQEMKNLIGVSEKTLLDMLKEEKETLRGFRFDLMAGKVGNIKELRKVKKNIARIKTAINAKAKIGKNNKSNEKGNKDINPK